MNQLSKHKLFISSPFKAELAEKPLGFIDIGARGDIHDLVSPLAEDTAILGFEPDAEECKKLLNSQHNKKQWREFFIEPTALSSGKKKCLLYRMAVPTNDSLRKVNRDYQQRYNMVKFEQIGTATVKTKALDSVLASSKYKHQDYIGELIKLDTQGTEFEILKGSIETLQNRTLGIMCEVSFFEMYKNQKLFSDIEVFLRKYGFSFYSFTWLGLRSQKLLDKSKTQGRERYFYADAVFLKDPYLSGKNQPKLNKSQKKRLVIIAMLFKYYDFALELAKEILSDEEFTNMKNLVKQIARSNPTDTIQRVEQILTQMKHDKPQANVIFGHFIKSMFGYFDYDDTPIG